MTKPDHVHSHAIVINENSIYYDMKLPILGIYLTHPDGKREYILDLDGTDIQKDRGYGYTVQHGDDLKLINRTLKDIFYKIIEGIF